MSDDFTVHINPGLSFADTSVSVRGQPTPTIADLTDADVFGAAKPGETPTFKTQVQSWLWDHGFTNYWGGAAERTGEVWFSPRGAKWLCTPAGGGRGSWLPNPQPARLIKRGLNARILSIQLQTVLAQKVIIDNRGGENPQPGTLQLSQSVEDAVESNWSRSQTVGVTVEVGVEVGPVKAQTSLSYESSWGVGGSKRRTSGVGSDASSDIEVEPGRVGLLCGLLKRGVIVAAVDFELAALDGHACVGWYWKHGSGEHDGSPLVIYDQQGHEHLLKDGYVPFADVCRRGGSPLRATQVFTTQNYAEALFQRFMLPDPSPAAVDAAVRPVVGIDEVYHHTRNDFEAQAVAQAKQRPLRLDR